MAKNKKSRKLIRRRYFIYILVCILGINFSWQIYKKPLEIWSLLPVNLAKTPTQTWTTYKEEFLRFENEYISATFLAALTQKESSGNPWASPGWIMRLTDNYEYLYGPQSTAFGLLQITKPTFHKTIKLCDNPTYQEYCGLWNTRLFASNSIALATLNLTHSMKQIEARFKIKHWNKQLKEKVAAIVHLCGEGVAKQFVRAGYRLSKNKYCGSHHLGSYIRSVTSLQRQFERNLN